MKITKYDPWIGLIPQSAEFIIAYLNNNYRISGLDLGTSLNGGGTSITDYIYDILEVPNGVITVFTLRYNYVLGSCHVYLRGLRQTPTVGYDYIELGNRQIQFFTAPETESNIVVDYLATDYIPVGIFSTEFDETFE